MTKNVSKIIPHRILLVLQGIVRDARSHASSVATALWRDSIDTSIGMQNISAYGMSSVPSVEKLFDGFNKGNWTVLKK